MHIRNAKFGRYGIGSIERHIPAGGLTHMMGLHANRVHLNGLKDEAALETLELDIATAAMEEGDDEATLITEIQLKNEQIQVAPYFNVLCKDEDGDYGYGAIVINAAQDNGTGKTLAAELAKAWLKAFKEGATALKDRPVAIAKGEVDPFTARTYTFTIQGGGIVGLNEMKVGNRRVCAMGLTPDGGALVDDIGVDGGYGVLEMIPSALKRQLETGGYGSVGKAFKMTGVQLASQPISFGQLRQIDDTYRTVINCTDHIVAGQMNTTRDVGTDRIGFQLVDGMDFDQVNLEGGRKVTISDVKFIGAERTVDTAQLWVTVRHGNKVLSGLTTIEDAATKMGLNPAGLTTLVTTLAQPIS